MTPSLLTSISCGTGGVVMKSLLLITFSIAFCAAALASSRNWAFPTIWTLPEVLLMADTAISVSSTSMIRATSRVLPRWCLIPACPLEAFHIVGASLLAKFFASKLAPAVGSWPNGLFGFIPVLNVVERRIMAFLSGLPGWSGERIDYRYGACSRHWD